jgi:DUF1016 N-terminal domain
MDFKFLLEQLHTTHDFMQNRAVNIVNQSLTLRNWLFGYYIIEFEQNGKDYAEYGSKLLYRLASELKKKGVKGVSYTNLTLFRKFYQYYPQFSTSILQLKIGEQSLNRNLQTTSEYFDSMQMYARRRQSTHRNYPLFC